MSQAANRWFISYNSKDGDVAEILYARLEKADPASEIFFAPRSLRGAGYWLPQLADAISRSTIFILVAGPNGLGPWQVDEYYEARDRRIPIAVLLLKGQAAPGLPFLRQFHWIISDDVGSDETIDQLLRAASSSRTQEGGARWRNASPYRGLTAMSEGDAGYFFGRDQETVAVLNLLVDHPDRLPVLLGNSGVGKSSVAQAGVIASLKAQSWPTRSIHTRDWPREFSDSRRFCYLTVRPGTNPVRALTGAFLDIWQFQATEPRRFELQNEWTDTLVAGRATLIDLMEATQKRYAELKQSSPPTFVIYVDQGEELYARCDSKVQNCFSGLVSGAIPDGRLYVFMSLRSDFLGNLQRDEKLFNAHKKVDVTPLREAALHEVVTQPPEMLQARYETPHLAADIARRTAQDASTEAGSLPLLSYLLDDMWSNMLRRGDGVLTLPAHAIELGAALAHRGDAFVERRREAVDTIKRVLTLKLASVREDGQPIRRRASRQEFDDLEWNLISELANEPNRLLVISASDTGEVYAEVAHEAIFHRWEQLKEWIASERDFLLWKARLEISRRTWERAPAEVKADALLMGFQLSQAKEQLATRRADLSIHEREYIQGSMDSVAVAEARKVRQRRLAIAASVLAVLMIGGGVWFAVLQQRKMAEQDQAAAYNRRFNGWLSSGVYDRAMREYNEKHYEAAVKLFSEGIEKEPDNALFHYARGNTYGKLNKIDEQIEDSTTAINLAPKSFGLAYGGRGDAYRAKSRWDEAIDDYKAGVGITPNAILYNSLGLAYEGKGDQKSALESYSKAVELDAAFGLGYANRADVEAKLGDRASAEKDYEKAVEVTPGDSELFTRRGNFYYSLHINDALAEASYTKAIELAPTATRYTNRGHLRFRIGKADDALADYAAAIKLDVTGTSLNLRGNEYYSQAKFDQAISDYSASLEIKAEPVVFENRALSYENQKKWDLAIKDYTGAIALKPDNAIYHNKRGQAYVTLGNNDAAIGDFQDAIKLLPTFSGAYWNIANIYFSKGQYELAQSNYEFAISNSPNPLWNNYNPLGLSMYYQGKYEGAIDNYNIALDRAPATEKAALLNNRGSAYREMGDPRAAIEDLNKAIDLNPSFARAYYNRANAFRWLEERESVEKDYRKVLELDPNSQAGLAVNCWFDIGSGALEKAIKECTEASSLRMNLDSYVLESLGEAHLKLGNLELAKSNFDKSLKIAPKLPESLAGRGSVRVRQGDASGKDDIELAKKISAEFSHQGSDAKP